MRPVGARGGAGKRGEKVTRVTLGWDWSTSAYRTTR